MCRSHFALKGMLVAVAALLVAIYPLPHEGAEAAPSLADSPAIGAASASSASPEAVGLITAEQRASLSMLSPTVLPRPPKDATNAFADDGRAAALGRAIFRDPRFSGKLLDGDNDGGATALGTKGETGRVACAGCHVPAAGYLDDRSQGRQISLAAGWVRRRAPSLLDVGQGQLFMWDGRRDALYNQPFGPLESPVEMNTSRLYVAEAMFRAYRKPYEALFGRMPPLDDAARFPSLGANLTGCQPRSVDPEPECIGSKHGLPGDHAEYDAMSEGDRDLVTRIVVNVGKALEAFERTLTCGQGRFDAWMHGRGSQLSPAEQRGAGVFVGRGQCVKCHAGPYFSDQSFHNVGLKPALVAVVFVDAGDRGAAAGLADALADPLNTLGKYSDGNDGRLSRATRGGLASLEGAFRTPGLRCVADRPSFMHTGQLKTLSEVVAFFDRGGDPYGYPGQNELHPLNLSQREQDDLVAFLRTLDGPGGRSSSPFTKK